MRSGRRRSPGEHTRVRPRRRVEYGPEPSPPPVLHAAILELDIAEHSSPPHGQRPHSASARSRCSTPSPPATASASTSSTPPASPPARSTRRSTGSRTSAYLKSSWEPPATAQAEGRPARRYFQLTADGRPGPGRGAAQAPHVPAGVARRRSAFAGPVPARTAAMTASAAAAPRARAGRSVRLARAGRRPRPVAPQWRADLWHRCDALERAGLINARTSRALVGRAAGAVLARRLACGCAAEEDT